MSLRERLTAAGPKRILALDGGGIRGAMTCGYLQRIEKILRERHGRPEMVLSDYFDLIGGTSTGAIIASGLSIGMSADELAKLYEDLGGKIFGAKKWKKWEALFDIKPLREALEKVFGDMTLGSDKVRTGLCIVTKRADTASTWPLINHPDGKYYADNAPILMRKAVRASTAAPVFFVPEAFEIAPGQVGGFVDGGVSMFNNPALQLFYVATLRGFPFHWKTGADELLLVSAGTGAWDTKMTAEEVTDSKLWNWTTQIPGMLMTDANWNNQVILQYLSTSPTAWTIDSEIGDLSDDLLTPAPAMTYLRYDEILEEDAMRANGLDEFAPKADALRNMSKAENRFDLAALGRASAAARVEDDHFPAAFDLA